MLLQLLINELAVNLEGIKAASAHGFLQRVNGERVEEVSFTFFTPLVFTTDIQGGRVSLTIRVGVAVTLKGLLGNDVHVSAFDTGAGVGEVFVHHGLVQAHGFKNLSAAIALHRRDTNLGGDLDDAFGGSLDEVVDRFLVVQIH